MNGGMSKEKSRVQTQVRAKLSLSEGRHQKFCKTPFKVDLKSNVTFVLKCELQFELKFVL